MPDLKRPDSLSGGTHKYRTGCGNMYVIVNLEQGVPYEIFVSLGKGGGCGYATGEGIARLVSLALQNKISVGEIVKQLKGITCHSKLTQGEKTIHALSCVDVIGRLLSLYEVKPND